MHDQHVFLGEVNTLHYVCANLRDQPLSLLTPDPYPRIYSSTKYVMIVHSYAQHWVLVLLELGQQLPRVGVAEDRGIVGCTIKPSLV